jgi:hypothetical protein
MHSLSVGLRNCSVTKRMDKCVTVLLGQIHTDDQGDLDVWASFSETALRSLQYDMAHPEAPRPGVELKMGECCVTSREAWCIQALIAALPEVVNGEPTGGNVLVHANFSLEGLERLLARLQEDVQVLDLAPIQAATRDTPYLWIAVHGDGEAVCQFGADGSEVKFASVRLPEVDMFLIQPKGLDSELPIYRLAEGVGFERGNRCRSGWVFAPLSLPMPNEPFAFVYYRRVTGVLLCTDGAGRPFPPRIVQVLGWRVPRPGGDLSFELGVEEDGSWAIHRRGRHGPDGIFIPLGEDEFMQALTERSE